MGNVGCGGGGGDSLFASSPHEMVVGRTKVFFAHDGQMHLTPITSPSASHTWKRSS